MPLLCLPKDLLHHEHVGVGRVDELGLGLPGHDLRDVVKDVADLVHGVSVVKQPAQENPQNRSMCVRFLERTIQRPIPGVFCVLEASPYRLQTLVSLELGEAEVIQDEAVVMLVKVEAALEKGKMQ